MHFAFSDTAKTLHRISGLALGALTPRHDLQLDLSVIHPGAVKTLNRMLSSILGILGGLIRGDH